MYYITWNVSDPSVIAGDPCLACSTFEEALACAQPYISDGSFESMYYEEFIVPESIHV